MKKLMIAAAIVCAAAMSHAAAGVWGTVDIIGPGGSDAAEGWKVYLVDGTKYGDFTALSAADVLTFLGTASNYLDVQDTYENRGSINVDGKGGNWAASTEEKVSTATGFLVFIDNEKLADAQNYAYTAVDSKVVGSAGADVTFDWGEDFTAAMSATGSSGGWQSVPEPTSGLLLLLGVAGLALRRRHA